MKSGVYILSMNEQGSVFINTLNMDDVEVCISLQTVTTDEPLVFPNIQAAFVDFLRPIYKEICGK